jgi:hypothetical protein
MLARKVPVDPSGEHGPGLLVELDGVELLGLLGLLDEVDDPPGGVEAQDAEPRGLLAGDQLDGDRQVGLELPVGAHELRDVHQVELVAREDQDLVGVLLEQPGEGLAHGVGRPLEPVAIVQRLLGGQNVDVAVAEGAEAVGLVDVAVEAGAVELGDDEDPVDPRVQAVADRDVDEAELPAHRHGRLRAVAGERPETGPLPSTENGCDDFFHVPSPLERRYLIPGEGDIRVWQASWHILYCP